MSGSELHIDRLGSDHVDLMAALNDAIASESPPGFFDRRSASDFADIVGIPTRSAALGAWDGDRCVGYCLTRQIDETPFTGLAFCRAIDAAKDITHRSSNLGLLKAARGQGVGRRLDEARYRLQVKMGTRHVFGFISAGNIASLRMVMQWPTYLVGLLPDPPNESPAYVTYRGRLHAGAPEKAGQRLVCLSDTDAQRGLFDEGWVAVSLRVEEVGVRGQAGTDRQAPALEFIRAGGR